MRKGTVVRNSIVMRRGRVYKMRKTGAVIVAAGLSSRMKAFKPSLPFGDSNVANHTVTKLLKVGINPITIVTGHMAEELKECICYEGIRYVHNDNYDSTQMFDSVILGVEDIKDLCDRILIMPMDLPAILTSTLEKMLRIDAGMIRTSYNGRPGHPIIIESDFAGTLKDYKGEDGLRGAMEHSNISITNIEVDDAAVQFDIDTPDQYHRLIEWNYERGNGYPVSPEIEVMLKTRQVFFDYECCELLKNIREHQSLQKACSVTGISYSKGSRMLKDMEWELGFPIVEKWTGGSLGGGSVLTSEGRRLIENYENFTREVKEEAEKIYHKYFAAGIRVADKL